MMASRLTSAVLIGFNSAAQGYHSIINQFLSKKYTPSVEEGAVPDAMPVWYGWKVSKSGIAYTVYLKCFTGWFCHAKLLITRLA
jgi:hypothetical protein